MTPLWGTKIPSAPVGDASGGDGRTARSPLSCALWRGMGRLWRGMGGRRPPRRQHGLLGIHQPRDTQHGFPLSSGDFKESNRKPGQQVFTKHERRLFSPCMRKGHTVRNHRPDRRARRPVTAFLRVVERHGAAMARHGRPPSPAPATRPAGFSPATGHATWFSPSLRRLQGEQPQARPTGFHESRVTRHESRLLWFSRITKHETRITAFFRITASLPAISHDFPPFPGISRPPHPPPLFSLGFPARAVSRSSRRRPGSFLCGRHTMNPC